MRSTGRFDVGGPSQGKGGVEQIVDAWLRDLEAKSTAVTPAAPTPLPLRRRA